MKYNPRLPDLNRLLKKHMPLLYTDPTFKTIFTQGCINSVFKRNQSLKELLAPNKLKSYLYTLTTKLIELIRSLAVTNVTFAKIIYVLIISHAVSPIEDII